MKYLKIANWSRWQNYRKDRGQPPWIKVHRCLIRNPDYVNLTDEQRGQLLGIWILAADKDGQIPDDPTMIAKICYMDKKPNLELFIRSGFIEKRRHRGVKVASKRQPHDIPETEAETETEKKPPYSPPLEGGAWFKKWWGAYPRKVGKKAALKAWLKVEGMKQTPELMGAKLYMALCAQVEAGHFDGHDGKSYVPHPSTWLNQGRWEDELQQVSEDERARILGEPTFQ